MPLPDYAEAFVREARVRATAAWSMRCSPSVRARTQIDVKRADFKLEQVPPHLFMNFQVVDEHGRQLGMGRNLAALKAELGDQARSPSRRWPA